MVLLLWSHRCWRAIISLSVLAALFLMQASCFYFPQNMLNVFVGRIPSFFSAKLLSGHLVPSLYCCKGLFYPRCCITLSGSVELHVVSGSPFRQPFSIPPSINPDISWSLLISVMHKLAEICGTSTVNMIYSGGCSRKCDLKDIVFCSLWCQSHEQGCAVISWCAWRFLCLNQCVPESRRLQAVSQHLAMVR